jgi:hypothetical protein
VLRSEAGDHTVKHLTTLLVVVVGAIGGIYVYNKWIA